MSLHLTSRAFTLLLITLILYSAAHIQVTFSWEELELISQGILATYLFNQLLTESDTGVLNAMPTTSDLVGTEGGVAPWVDWAVAALGLLAVIVFAAYIEFRLDKVLIVCLLLTISSQYLIDFYSKIREDVDLRNE